MFGAATISGKANRGKGRNLLERGTLGVTQVRWPSGSFSSFRSESHKSSSARLPKKKRQVKSQNGLLPSPGAVDS